MNRRLHAIENMILPGIGVIDVGTDHGYLPVSLARHGYPGALFASDIGEGPLSAARRSAETAGLGERIAFQLCDGLDLCDPASVDTIVIAGMGGDTICGILDRAEWCMHPRYRLILQPMTRAEVLRYWLVNNEFIIEEEQLVADGGEIYAVFSARFGGSMKLTDAELYTGAFAMLEQDPLWPAFLAKQLARFRKLLHGLRQSGREPGRLELAEGIQQDLEKERIKYGDSTGDF